MPMSEQTGGTHGPREDDALKREVRSELQAHRATRSEEWLEPEPPGEDEPEATWAPEGRPGGSTPGESPWKSARADGRTPACTSRASGGTGRQGDRAAEELDEPAHDGGRVDDLAAVRQC